VKRALIFASYVAIAVVDAALGQSDYVKTIKTVAVPVTSSDHANRALGMMPPATPPADPYKDLPTVVPRYVPPPPEKVVIARGDGGRLDLHRDQFAGYRNAQAKVELRGPCYSACTLITAYVDKDNLCIAKGAFLAFHQVRSGETGKIMPAETALMYWQFPADIQHWIDRMGGHQKMPLAGYWTMQDRDLWAMGYPKCTEIKLR
jgi:hypothetical protein